MSIHRFAAVLCLAMPGLAAAQVFDPPDIPACLELVPGAVSVADVPVTLHLRVLLDGVSAQRADEAVAAARAAYAPLRVGLSVSYDSVRLASGDAGVLIEEARRHYGGRRPSGAHAVYVLTGKDLYLTDETGQRDATVAGLADCIGGIAYADRAFAVGEALPDDPFQLGVLAFGRNLAGKVLGHEVGHLLGGHHHYANCAQIAPQFGDAPCTLMINDIGLAGLDFSSLNGLIVRGHAQLAGSPGFMESNQGVEGGGALSLPFLLALLMQALLRRAITRTAPGVSSSTSRTSAAAAE